MTGSLQDALCAFAARASTLDDQFVETTALTLARRGDVICFDLRRAG